MIDYLLMSNYTNYAEKDIQMIGMPSSEKIFGVSVMSVLRSNIDINIFNRYHSKRWF